MSLLSPSLTPEQGSEGPPHRSLTGEAQEGGGATVPAHPVPPVGVPAGDTRLRPSGRGHGPSTCSLCGPQGHRRGPEGLRGGTAPSPVGWPGARLAGSRASGGQTVASPGLPCQSTWGHQRPCSAPARGQGTMAKGQVGPWGDTELHPTPCRLSVLTTSWGVGCPGMEGAESGKGSPRTLSQRVARSRPFEAKPALLWAPGCNLGVPFLGTRR